MTVNERAGRTAEPGGTGRGAGGGETEAGPGAVLREEGPYEYHYAGGPYVAGFLIGIERDFAGILYRVITEYTSANERYPRRIRVSIECSDT